MKRSVFATNLDELLGDRPNRFRWWSGELQVPRATLHRWATVGLAKPDSRSEPYLKRLVDYFGLPDHDCLWQKQAKSKTDESRIRMAATRPESLVVRQKQSPQQATRIIEDAGLWKAFMQRVGATDQTEAELTLADMVMNGNWDSRSIMDHMQSRGTIEVDLESKVERTKKGRNCSALGGMGSQTKNGRVSFEPWSGFSHHRSAAQPHATRLGRAST